MKKVSLKSLVWKEGRYFVAQCLNVDVSSFGTTKANAVAALKEALELYFDGSQKMPTRSVVSPIVYDTVVQCG